MSVPEVVYITAEPGSVAPSMRVGGLTVLERRLLEAQRRGILRAIVAIDTPLPERAFTLSIEQDPGASPPAGAEIVRADELAGVRIENRRDGKRAEWAHLRSLPKSFQGPVDALINCHFSLRITRLLAKTPITPNMVTVVALLIGLGAAGLLVWGAPAAIIVAGVLMEFQSIVDSCDGELARLRFQFSKLGQWLDNLADDITDATLMFGLGVAAGGRTWFILGCAAAAARVFTQLILYWQVKRVGGDFWNFRWWFETEVGSLDEVYDMASPMTWIRSLGRRDVYLFLWGVACVAGQPMIAAGYAVGIAGIFTVMTLMHLVLSKPPTR